jgi:two-component system sensor histidine kinase KdpD
LGTASSSLERLKALIENLLDMSRLQAGSLAVHLQEVSVYDVIPPALKSIAVLPEAVELIEGAEVSDIRTDPGLLERVLANLVDNAISYGTSDKKPQISISEHDKEVQVRIIDYGKGIPQAMIQTAFAPFKRLGDVENDRGVGLGLALSHGLAEAIGAKLSLEETPGGGLTAIVSIPTSGSELEKTSNA